MGDVLVRGGTIVDGTGGPRAAGDVRVRDGIIAEVGEGLSPDGEDVIDASGALVTPGLIDPHTHYDLEMFWDPTLDPLPSYGMTTIVMGNCGLGIAPVARRGARRHRRPALLHRGAAASLCRRSACRGAGARGRSTARSPRRRPRPSRRSRTPRTTRCAASRWAATRGNGRRPTPNASSWSCCSRTRSPTGSLGMSTNWFDTDRNRELVPSRLSDDAELDALIDVLARHRSATLQVIARGSDRPSPRAGEVAARAVCG